MSDFNSEGAYDAMRIGGEFEISLEDFVRPKQDMPFFYKKKENYLQVDTGRSALLLALQDILRKGGERKAWVPAFSCDSVLLPFIQLGFSLHFYSMGEDLQSPRVLPDEVKGSTFLFINYFGKANHRIMNWIKTHPHRSQMFVIEDNVQAMLSRNVGDTGDYVVYSFRKFLPQPDGAVLAFNQSEGKFVLEDPDENFVSGKVIGKIIRGTQTESSHFLQLFHKTEDRINSDIRPRSISFMSQFLLERTEFSSIAEVRKDNWENLYYMIRSEGEVFSNITPLFNSLEKEEVPLGFPVRITNIDRDSLRQYLAEKHIYCPIHWDIQGRPQATGWPDELLSRNILTIPIDQRVGLREIEYIFHQLNSFVKRYG